MPRSWLPRRILLTILVVAAVFATACGDDAAESRPFDTIELRDFDSRPAELAQNPGRPLVVNFFAESCAPCVAEMPAFDAVHRAMGDEIDFVGVSEDATAAAGRRIVAATAITYPTVWDADGSALTRFEAFGLPTTLFVTADGEIAETHTGVLTEASLTAKIEDLLTNE